MAIHGRTTSMATLQFENAISNCAFEKLLHDAPRMKQYNCFFRGEPKI